MLAWRLLWRNWRSGEVKLLAVALVLSVTVVSTIALFTGSLERTMMAESSALLGGDRIVTSNRQPQPEWMQAASEREIRQTMAAHFGSMVFAGEEMHLASVKAVDTGYPLRGEIETSQVPFTMDESQIAPADGIPARGEAWVDSRILPLLNIELGDSLQVGEESFVATRVIIREPDGTSPFGLLGARVMINWADLPATRVIQPGSRVEYHWLLAADETPMSRFIEWLEPSLSEHENVLRVENAQRRLQGTLQTGRRFLVLAAMMGVLLAGVAIALASRQFADRHINQVALLKSLGARTSRVRVLYALQLLLLALVASVVGVLLGTLIQWFIAEAVARLYFVRMAPPGLLAYVLSVLSGPLCLLGFALPALWYLPKVPPIKVLRQEMAVPASAVSAQVLMALGVLLLLVSLFSRDLWLGLSVVVALGAVALLAIGLALGLLASGRRLGSQAGSYWRLALGSIQRRKSASVVQVVVFATAVMLLLTLTIVRTSLIDEWQVKVPERAPNHFLINVPPEARADLVQLLEQNDLNQEQLYPMVRGRLTHINGNEKLEEGIEREVNLTWSEQLGPDNQIVAGDWWGNWQRTDLPGVSVEVEVAERLGLALGDTLTFSLGGLEARAEVASFRTLEWESMQPNFFFIFQPGALDDFSPMYMTSVYISPDQKGFINTLLREHPTIVVLELDRIIDQIRTIITQVSDGVQLVLLLVLVGGILVLIAAVTGSLASRKQEAGLLRALGSPGRLIVNSVWVEFAVLGLVAGVIAVVGAEVLLLSLQVWVFEVPVQPHYVYWVATPLAVAALVGALGAFSCRQVVTTSPARVLREAA